MKIFITGASGFVGGAAARALQPEYDIRAMARSEGSMQKIRDLGVEPVLCSLGDVEAKHLEGCNTVIHCAASVGQWGSETEFWENNVEGTSRLLQVAKAAGVSRFIHLSTESVLVYGQHMRDIDEGYPYPKKTPFLYSRTKGEAERRVLAENSDDFTTIALRPRMIWGPGDQTILPPFKRAVEEGRFVWVDGGRAITSTTYIANLVNAIELALTHGEGGETYFITDAETRSIKEFITALLSTQNITISDRAIPGWLAGGLAIISEGIWKVLGLGGEPPLTRFAMSLMSRDCTIRIDKAKRELGYKPIVGFSEGIEQLRG